MIKITAQVNCDDNELRCVIIETTAGHSYKKYRIAHEANLKKPSVSFFDAGEMAQAVKIAGALWRATGLLGDAYSQDDHYSAYAMVLRAIACTAIDEDCLGMTGGSSIYDQYHDEDDSINNIIVELN